MTGIPDLPQGAAPAAGTFSFESTTDPDSPVTDLFFEHFDRAFILPHEKETLEGFRDCLALNRGEASGRLRGRYGPFREAVLIARTPDGEIAGGANYIAFGLGGKSPLLAINLNYIFVAQAWRGRGYFRQLLGAVRLDAALLKEAAKMPAAIFIEQNDPFVMTGEDYAADTAHGGLDQFQRIAIWAKLGARIVDFPYIQPPLSAAQEPDTGLCYAVIGMPADALDACLLREHLLRFFAISVLKGRDPESDPAARSQLAMLAEACAAGRTIPLLNPGRLTVPAMMQIRAMSSGSKTLSLRDAVRNPAT
jgi:GNAT superfamily N-acetyltransferase